MNKISTNKWVFWAVSLVMVVETLYIWAGANIQNVRVSTAENRAVALENSNKDFNETNDRLVAKASEALQANEELVKVNQQLLAENQKFVEANRKFKEYTDRYCPKP